MNGAGIPDPTEFGAAMRRLTSHDEAPDARWVRLLSAPSPREVQLWAEQWPHIDCHRRRWIASRMLETAESSFEVDFGPLFAQLLDDDDADVRAAAIDGLWESRQPRLIAQFTALLQNDTAPAVRARAADNLGQYILLAELEEIGSELVADALTALVSAATDASEAAEVRRRALESAGYADNPEVRSIIRDAFESDEPTLQAGAMRAMGRSADDRWDATVIAGLRHQRPDIRLEAARAAGELGLADAVPDLLALAESDQPEIQLEAIWALGEVGGKAGTRALERIASWSTDPILLHALEEALAMAALSLGELAWPTLDSSPGAEHGEAASGR